MEIFSLIPATQKIFRLVAVPGIGTFNFKRCGDAI